MTQLAALGHGVAGIDGEVHDDLLQHAGVGLERREGRTRSLVSTAMSSPSRRVSMLVRDCGARR